MWSTMGCVAHTRYACIDGPISYTFIRLMLRKIKILTFSSFQLSLTWRPLLGSEFNLIASSEGCGEAVMLWSSDVVMRCFTTALLYGVKHYSQSKTRPNALSIEMIKRYSHGIRKEWIRSEIEILDYYSNIAFICKSIIRSINMSHKKHIQKVTIRYTIFNQIRVHP